MNFKANILLLILLITSVLAVEAQNKTIIGKVVRGEDSTSISGANVTTYDGEYNTTTDNYGIYKIEIPETATTLTFSFVGLTTVKVELNDNDVINATLFKEGVIKKEMVTTAFGIKQEKKAVGYAVQEVKGGDVSRIIEDNFINSLSGKFAGVQTISSSGGIGASARITIRGCNSFTGSNQPLFVLDGIPIDNRTNLILNSGNGGDYGVDFGNSVSDINQFDIEAVSILKGANAAALYGSRAANGVVILNTKIGLRPENQLGVIFYSNLSFESPLKLPEFQNKYGQGSNQEFSYVDGEGGGINDGVDENWGPLLDGTDRPQFFGVGPWSAHPNNIRNIFETGTTYSNYVALSNATDNGNVYLSFGNMDRKGMIPNTSSNKKTVFLKSGVQIKHLFVSAAVNYFLDESNRTGNGYNTDNIMDQSMWAGRQVDFSLFKSHYMNPDGSQYNWNRNYHDNVYWTLYKKAKEMKRYRLIGNVNAKYDVTDWLTVFTRFGGDLYNEVRQQKYPKYGIETPEGKYSKENIYMNENNADVLITASKTVNNTSNVSISMGANYMSHRSRNSSVSVNGLVTQDIFAISNASVNPISYEFYSKMLSNSVYGFAKYSYNSLFFIDFTARNDWSSTLPKSNYSFFYPSVSSSLIVSDLPFFRKSKNLSYIKLRMGWASVGNSAGPYQLVSVMNSSASFGNYPYFYVSNEIPPEDLMPENTKSTEIGLDVKFLNDRAESELTYYQSNTNNQIMGVNITSATGYTTLRVNAGVIENKGIEWILKLKPISKQNFAWDVIWNYAKNKNTVKELYGSMKSLKLGEYLGVNLEAQVRQPYGVIVGNAYLRDANGRRIIDADGLPQSAEEAKILGNILPNWIGGLRNQFTYSNFILSFLIDFKMGGSLYSYTHRAGIYTGSLDETLTGREDGLVVDGVKANGTPNDTRVDAETYYKSLQYIHEADVFDASYIKFREFYISYQIPNYITRKVRISKAVITVNARNLWLIHSNIPNVDPETEFGTENAVQGFEYGQIPSIRSFGFQIRIEI